MDDGQGRCSFAMPDWRSGLLCTFVVSDCISIASNDTGFAITCPVVARGTLGKSPNTETDLIRSYDLSQFLYCLTRSIRLTEAHKSCGPCQG